MNSNEDPFDVLGVPPGSDARTIRKTYLRLIKKTKPEENPVGFARIRAAFEAIKSEEDAKSLTYTTSFPAEDPDLQQPNVEENELPLPAAFEQPAEVLDDFDEEPDEAFQALDEAIEAIRNNDVNKAQLALRKCWRLSEGASAASFSGDRYAAFILSMLKELWEARDLLRPKEFCQLGCALIDQDTDMTLRTIDRLQRNDSDRWDKIKRHLEGPGARLSTGLGISFQRKKRGDMIAAILFLAFSMTMLYLAMS